MSSEYGQFLGRRPEDYFDKEIALTFGKTEVKILRLGATITGWKVGGKDVIFPFQDIESKLRGGIPILFPIAGLPKEDGEFARLPQHGLAREGLWTVSNAERNEKSVLMGLHADTETRNLYPYNFGLGAQITVNEGVLRYDLVVANNEDKKEMPFVLGLHPYFQLPSLGVLPEIETNIPGFSPEQEALKRSLICDLPEEVIKIEIPKWGLVTMTPSEEFQKLIIWTDGRGPYLCVEPWTSGPLTIDDSRERITLPPRKSIDLSLEIEFHPA